MPSEFLSSDSLIVTQMACPFDVELVDGGIELVDGAESLMGKEVTFEIAPGSLDIVEFGGVFGQPLDGQPRARVECGARELAGVDRSVVEHQHDRLSCLSRSWPVERVEPFQEADEIGATLGVAAMHDQPAGSMIERADERQLASLARCRHAQISTSLGPGVRQIRMRQRLGFVLEQQDDVARFGLTFQELEPKPGAIYGAAILSASKAVAGPSPSVAVFFSALLSCDFEMETSARRVISACRRGNVQFARSATGAVNTDAATPAAASLLTLSRPGRALARRPSTPLSANQLRHRRTLSGVTPNARAICPLVQPLIDNTTARARSASSRRSDRASACNASTCSAVETTRGRPAMTHPTARRNIRRVYDMWHDQGNPA